MGIAEYHQVEGKTEIMPIDESHDSVLKCAKKVTKEQHIQDMKWVGKHIARQANFNGEDIVIVIIPLKEWQEIANSYPIYEEMSKRKINVGL